MVLVEFDSFGKEEIKKVKLKDTREFNTIEDVFNIKNELTKLEREIAKGYNFQNLDRINETFKKFLKIDIRAILSIKKKVIEKNVFLATELEELIERRHWIIHHFGFSSDTDKEKYIYFLNLTNSIIDTIIEFLEQQKKMKITENSIYYGTTL